MKYLKKFNENKSDKILVDNYYRDRNELIQSLYDDNCGFEKEELENMSDDEVSDVYIEHKIAMEKW